MRHRVGVFISAPIEVVFAFYDDPANVARLRDDPELVRSDVREVRPDGSRTFDLTFRDAHSQWVQTYIQDVREAPYRHVIRAWTWTADRAKPIAAQRTERRLVAVGLGTRVELDAEMHYPDPWRHLPEVVSAWLWGYAAARSDLEHSLHRAAEHLEQTDGSPPLPRDIR